MLKNLVMLLGLNGESDSLFFNYYAAIDNIVNTQVVNDSVLKVDYDIDRNGFPETTAYFEITEKYLYEVVAKEYAFKVEISCDGKSKLVLEDTNNNSFLDKKYRVEIKR